MVDVVEGFAAEMRRSVPERMALAVARLAFPDLEIAPYLRQLDEMAEIIAPRIAHAAPGKSRATAFLDAIRSDLGFRGNADDYYAAENSFLNLVLARRTGLPILLSLVCMALGRRAGLTVEGMGFPGHFMARYQDAAGTWLLDPFHGAVVAPEAAAAYLESLFGRAVALPPEAFTPVTTEALCLRILNNLRNVYVGQSEHGMAAAVVELMLVAAPDSTLLWQEHGLLAQRAGDETRAARSLRRYFFLTGQLALTFPRLAAHGATGEPLSQTDRHLLHVLQDIESKRGQFN